MTFPGEVVLAPGRSSVVLGPGCFVRCRGLVMHAATIKVEWRAGGPLGQASENMEVVLETTEDVRPARRAHWVRPPGSLELRVPAETRLD